MTPPNKQRPTCSRPMWCEMPLHRQQLQSQPPTNPRNGILPKNLRHAVKHLSDGELDLMHTATLEEIKRRGRLPPSTETRFAPSSRRPSDLATKRLPATNKLQRQQVDVAEVSLTRGQVNAVRAAFKAGITPSRIARPFGISQSNVRKALSGDPSK